MESLWRRLRVGFDRSGDLVLLTEDTLSDPTYLSALCYVMLDYRGERVDLFDGRFWLQRVVFLSGLERNLAVYRVYAQPDENP